MRLLAGCDPLNELASESDRRAVPLNYTDQQDYQRDQQQEVDKPSQRAGAKETPIKFSLSTGSVGWSHAR